MSNFLDAVKSSALSAVCLYMGANAQAEAWFNELSPIDLPSTGQFFNRSICDRPEPLPSEPPPFSGGQCPGVEYLITFRRRTYPVRGDGQCIVSESTLRSASGIGPVSLGPLEVTDLGDRLNYQQQWVFADGNDAGLGLSQLPECPAPSLFDISVSRVDGQPDDCGNPTPDIPPFPTEGQPLPITITYEDNDNVTVIETGDLTIFAPVVVAPVTIVAPVRVNLPDVTFDGTLTLAPEFDIQIGPSGIDDSPGTTPGNPPPENPDTSPTTPDDDSGRNLIGAVVSVSNAGDSKATRIGQDGSPDLFVPRLGLLTFRTRNSGAMGWTKGVDIQYTRQYVPVPDNTFAVTAEFQPNPNVSGTVTLVYEGSDPDT